MSNKKTQAMISIEPGGPIPNWTLPWANIWVDQIGGMHWSRYTHGTIFEAIFAKNYGRPIQVEESDWMFENIGSVADVDLDDDNPGWQFNELAVRRLGWIRIKATDLGGLSPEFTVGLDDMASKQALNATIRLLRAHPKTTTVDLRIDGDFSTELAVGKALLELRACARDAEPAIAGVPPYIQKKCRSM